MAGDSGVRGEEEVPGLEPGRPARAGQSPNPNPLPFFTADKMILDSYLHMLIAPARPLLLPGRFLPVTIEQGGRAAGGEGVIHQPCGLNAAITRSARPAPFAPFAPTADYGQARAGRHRAHRAHRVSHGEAD